MYSPFCLQGIKQKKPNPPTTCQSPLPLEDSMAGPDTHLIGWPMMSSSRKLDYSQNVAIRLHSEAFYRFFLVSFLGFLLICWAATFGFFTTSELLGSKPSESYNDQWRNKQSALFYPFVSHFTSQTTLGSGGGGDGQTTTTTTWTAKSQGTNN